jgi:predicted  nucleic acid-binding Zn-ribbon protein
MKTIKLTPNEAELLNSLITPFLEVNSSARAIRDKLNERGRNDHKTDSFSVAYGEGNLEAKLMDLRSRLELAYRKIENVRKTTRFDSLAQQLTFENDSKHRVEALIAEIRETEDKIDKQRTVQRFNSYDSGGY